MACWACWLVTLVLNTWTILVLVILKYKVNLTILYAIRNAKKYVVCCILYPCICICSYVSIYLTHIYLATWPLYLNFLLCRIFFYFILLLTWCPSQIAERHWTFVGPTLFLMLGHRMLLTLGQWQFLYRPLIGPT